MTEDATTPATPAAPLDFDPVPALASAPAPPPKGLAPVTAPRDAGNTVPFSAG